VTGFGGGRVTDGSLQGRPTESLDHRGVRRAARTRAIAESVALTEGVFPHQHLIDGGWNDTPWLSALRATLGELPIAAGRAARVPQVNR